MNIQLVSNLPVSLHKTFIGSLVGVVMLGGASIYADTTPIAPVQSSTILVNRVISDLEADTALAAKVTLTAKAQTIKQVLASLQEQSGIRLTPDPNALKIRRLVTARVKDMPLSVFLGSLTRMYGIEWVKDGDKSYVMRSGQMDDLRRSLLAIGEPYWYRSRLRFRYNVEAEEKRLAEIAQYVYRNLGGDALTSPEGVPFTSLPEEWRPEIRRIIEMPRAEALIRERRSIDHVFSRPLFLHLGETPPDIMPGGPGITVPHGYMPRLSVRDAEGRFIAHIRELEQSLLSKRATTNSPTATTTIPNAGQ